MQSHCSYRTVPVHMYIYIHMGQAYFPSVNLDELKKKNYCKLIIKPGDRLLADCFSKSTEFHGSKRPLLSLSNVFTHFLDIRWLNAKKK